MRKILFLLGFCIAFAACSSDSFLSGDTPLSYLVTEMADMHVVGDKVKSIVTDGDEELPIGSLTVSETLARPDTTYRVLLYYNKVEGKNIEILNSAIAKILEPKSEKPFEANDPLTYTSGWMGMNGKYVNLALGIKVANTDNSKAGPELQLYQTSVETLESGKKCYNVTLLYDSKGMFGLYTEMLYYSIPTAHLTDGDELKLTVNTYNGKIERTFIKGKSNKE